MANGNFVVQNGLTVGPLTIFSGNGDIITSGNLTSAAASVSFDSINNTPVGNTAPSTGAFTTLSATTSFLTGATIGNLSVSGSLITGNAQITGGNISGVAINFDSINNTPIGTNVPNTGAFTTLTASGNVALSTTLYASGIYDNSNRVVSTTSGTGNLSISGTDISLQMTGPGAVTVGSATAIPIVTTDVYGRVSSLSSAAVSSTLALAGNTGVGSVNLLNQTLTVDGGVDISTVASGTTIIVNDTSTLQSVTGRGATTTNPVNLTGGATISSVSANDITANLVTSSNVTVQYLQGITGLDNGNISVSSNIVPTANNVYNLGSPNFFFHSLFLGGSTLVIGGQTISANASGITFKTRGGSEFSFGDNYGFSAKPYISGGGGNGNGKSKVTALAITDNTNSTSPTTGALTVPGGAGIEQDLYVGGSIYATSVNAGTIGNAGATVTGSTASFGTITASGDIKVTGNLIVANIVSQNSSSITVNEPLLYLQANTGTPYNFDIGIYSHFVGGPANQDMHTGIVRNHVDDTWYFFSNVYPEPISSVVNFTDGNIIYDSVRLGSITVSNTVPSTSSLTGALTVAGGAGIAGSLYAGSVYDNGLRAVTSVTPVAGTGISVVVNGSTGPAAGFTIDNTGIVSAVAGTGISVSGTNPLTITNTGVTTLNGGTDISVSASTGTVTVNDTSTLQSVTGRGATTSNPVTFTGQVDIGNNIIPTANATYNLGSTTAWFNQFYGVATHAYYADLAENYQADKAYQPGTVLMFGGLAEVTVADADTIRVAGVVSTNPATLMNGGLTGPNVVPVAFTGRVPCNVIGPVAKGDLMVSAGFGYAKVNNTPQIGQVIGKALQDYPINGKGVIEVVVGRF